MDYNMFCGLCGIVFGILLSWFVISIRQQKQYLIYKTEHEIFEHKMEALHQELIKSQHICQQTENQLRDDKKELCELYSRLATAEEKLTLLAHFRKECEQLNQELLTQRNINNNQEIELREMIIKLEEKQISAEEKQLLLVNNEQQLSVQFENLANRIFEQSGRKVEEQNRQSLDQLLIPLREQLDGFRRQIQDSFGQEARERHTLTYEIRNLQNLNAQMAQETINLTRALKGNNKTQGNWGEMVLSRVLEASGLREGYEFDTQINLKQDDGRKLQPDVIVRLPQGKDVIIDAKISLVAYERYFNSDNEIERQIALSEHVNSLRAHMKILGCKDYQQLPGLRSLDYVLMFVPIEPAFMVAISHQPELINESLSHNIMLASPTTLLVALRTINNLWRYEYQSSNAQHIAEKAARLYDKIRLFVDDMNAIGRSLDNAQASYRLARNKLAHGRGNIIGQAEGFRTMGVEIKRPITPISNIDEQFTNETKTACSKENIHSSIK